MMVKIKHTFLIDCNHFQFQFYCYNFTFTLLYCETLSMLGFDPNINDTLVEKCALENETLHTSRQVAFSTQPELFIKWTKPKTGKIILQLVKQSGKFFL